MVVCQKQALLADELPCSSAEGDHGAHQAGTVGLVKLPGVHLKSQLLKIQILHLMGHPHPIVGQEDHGKGQAKHPGRKEAPRSLHLSLLNCFFVHGRLHGRVPLPYYVPRERMFSGKGLLLPVRPLSRGELSLQLLPQFNEPLLNKLPAKVHALPLQPLKGREEMFVQVQAELLHGQGFLRKSPLGVDIPQVEPKVRVLPFLYRRELKGVFRQLEIP